MTALRDELERAAAPAPAVAPVPAEGHPVDGEELLDESRGMLGIGRSLTFPFPQRRANDEYRTVYCDVGEGPAVVFLHGLGANFTHWEHVMRGLAGRHRVIGMDFVGCGSTLKPRRHYDIACLREHLLDFLARRGLRKVTLAGHSLGAAVSLATALARPDLVESLVLVGPPGISRFPAWMRLGAPLVLHEPILYPALRYGARAILNLVFVDRAEENSYVRHFEEGALRDEPGYPNLHDFARVATTLCRDAVRLDFERDLPTLKIPVLALWGDRDGLSNSPAAYRNLMRVPRIRAVSIPRCGHMPLVERPHETLAHIERFLADPP